MTAAFRVPAVTSATGPGARLGPAANWLNEVGLDAISHIPDTEVRYEVQWHDALLTDQTTYNIGVQTQDEPDWKKMTKAAYLAKYPFPGPRSFNEVAALAPQTAGKAAETVWPSFMAAVGGGTAVPPEAD